MQTKLFNQLGDIIGDAELPDRIFGLAIKPGVISQVLKAQSANARQVLAHTKGRGEVRGGGRKPWRQKGTGRARHASIRSPIWRGGGVAFGPTKERNFKQKINKKMKRQALFMSLSSKIRDNEFLLLDDFKLNNLKTKEALNIFKQVTSKIEGYRQGKKKMDRLLFVLSNPGDNIQRAIYNLPFVETTSAQNLNVREILENKYLILLKSALSVIEKTYK